MSAVTLRFATADDVGLLLQLIHELAAYERAPEAVVATEEDLRRYGFGPERQFEASVRVCRRRACRLCSVLSGFFDVARPAGAFSRGPLRPRMGAQAGCRAAADRATCRDRHRARLVGAPFQCVGLEPCAQLLSAGSASKRAALGCHMAQPAPRSAASQPKMSGTAIKRRLVSICRRACGGPNWRSFPG